jgi:hypothetical protein
VAKTKQKKGQGSKGGKAKAADATKLPKRIAGVKVPKELRQSGGKLLEAVSHPLVMDIAAAALMAAAARLRDEASKSRLSDEADGAQGSASPALGTLLAATAAEGIRKIAESARTGAKGNGRAGDKERGGTGY